MSRRRKPKPERVIIAMYDDGLAAVASTLLVGRGHRVEIASHPRDVTDGLKVRDVDVVMLDGAWAGREGMFGMSVLKRHAARSVRFVLAEEESAAHAADYEHGWFDKVLVMPAVGRDLIDLVEGSRSRRRRYQPDIQRRGLAA